MAYEKALTAVAKFMDILLPDHSAEEELDKWIFCDENDRVNQWRASADDDRVLWQNLGKFDEMRAIATVALRIISIGTSESDVERVISMHKYIARDGMTNISANVILARLRLKCVEMSNINLRRMQRPEIDY